MSGFAGAVPKAEPWPGTGEGRALGALEERYEGILRSHGAALARVAATYEADPSKRDDLVQDICLALWRALPGFRGESSERTFVFRIAHNRGLSHGFHQGRRATVGLDGLGEHDPVDPRHDPESEAVASDRRSRLRWAVRSLPLPARQVLALSLEGLAQREIGEVLGVSEGNVAVRLHRAKKALRERLQALESRLGTAGGRS